MQEETPAKSTAILGPTRQSLQAATPTNSAATLRPEVRPLKTINNIQGSSAEHLETTSNNENDDDDDDDDDDSDGDPAEDRSYSEEDTDSILSSGDDLGLYQVTASTP